MNGHCPSTSSHACKINIVFGWGNSYPVHFVTLSDTGRFQTGSTRLWEIIGFRRGKIITLIYIRVWKNLYGFTFFFVRRRTKSHNANENIWQSCNYGILKRFRPSLGGSEMSDKDRVCLKCGLDFCLLHQWFSACSTCTQGCTSVLLC